MVYKCEVCGAEHPNQWSLNQCTNVEKSDPKFKIGQKFRDKKGNVVTIDSQSYAKRTHKPLYVIIDRIGRTTVYTEADLITKSLIGELIEV